MGIVALLEVVYFITEWLVDGAGVKPYVHYLLDLQELPHLPTTKEESPLTKSQRKAMLVRRKWRRVREKRIRAYTKAFIRYVKGGGDADP
jgi:hypothetical protein